jgi:hypothetical protein
MEYIKDVIESVFNTHDNDRSLNNKIPHQVFKDDEEQQIKHINDSSQDQNIYKSVPFDSGQKVRTLEYKGKFEKGKLIFSKEIYTLYKRGECKVLVDNCKVLVDNDERKNNLLNYLR